MTFSYKEFESPVGKLKLVASANALVGVLWAPDDGERFGPGAQEFDAHHPILVRTERQLIEYFAGKRTDFELPLEPRGTEFQKKVWASLTTIPFGKTRSYRDIAIGIGSPRACRAVGSANGKNPLPIVVPCHRVVGTNGALTGFNGGVETKAKLLAFERDRVCTHIK